MRLPVHFALVALGLLGSDPAAPQGDVHPAVRKYPGMCEASAAVAAGSDRFLVANDEDNVLRLYQVDKPDATPGVFDAGAFLKLEKPEEGIDIEGAAELDGAVYLITSHGRSKKGKIKPDRFRFFAVSAKEANGKTSLEVVGHSANLMKDLLADENLRSLGLDPLTAKEDEKLAPEEGGTNIEGLAAWQKDQLLIALRNPVPNGNALLVPLENPAQVIKGEKARFGAAIALDLGDLGIRSLKRLPSGDYLIVAGPPGCGSDFRLFLWSGEAGQKKPDEVKGFVLAGLHPEAAVVFPGRKEVLLLSDDGDVRVQGRTCGEIPDKDRTFRGRLIPLPGR
jgi:hypothetical protein